MYRVLTIDDDPTILRAYKELHRQEGASPVDQLLELDLEGKDHREHQRLKDRINFEVDISNSGEDGLHMVRTAVEQENPYAVIYLDMRMPGRWNGLETAREIRSIDQEVRILVVTAYTEDIEKLHEIVGDAFVYLKKPFVKEELIQMTRFLAFDWQSSRDRKLKTEEMYTLNEAKSQFLSVISHELRTPLATLMGNSDLLAQQLQNGEQRALMKEVMQAVRTLQQLYDELFDAAQIQHKLIALDTAPFNLDALLTQLNELFYTRAAGAGLNFSIENGVEVDRCFIGDGKRLQQVLNKLLSNAIKFTRSGTVKLRVQAVAEEQLQFVVEDSGIGMPEEMVKSLIQPFSQMEMGHRRNHGGMGLGLYICNGLVNQMNGTLDWQSEMEKGTTVSLTVPLQRGETLQKCSRTEAQDEKRSGRMLLIDDAQEMQLLVKRKLAALGVELVSAFNGNEGIDQALHHGPFDLVIVDLRMPGMDGLEVTRILRKQNQTIPIIMLGADCTEQNGLDAKEAGAYCMLPKPLRGNTLEQLVALYAPYASASNGNHAD